MEWKNHLESRGMEGNIGKSKLMVTGNKSEVIRSGKYSCGVCGRGVGSNSIFSTSCQCWCNKRCLELRLLWEDPKFI